MSRSATSHSYFFACVNSRNLLSSTGYYRLNSTYPRHQIEVLWIRLLARRFLPCVQLTTLKSTISVVRCAITPVSVVHLLICADTDHLRPQPYNHFEWTTYDAVCVYQRRSPRHHCLIALLTTYTERPSKQVYIVGQLISADARPPTLHVISSCTRSVHVITSTFPGLDLLLHRISGDKSAVTHQVALDIRSSRIGVEILSVHWAHLTLRLVPFAVNISLAFIDHWCVSELELPICLSFTLGKFDIVHEALIAFSRPFTILLSVQTHTTLGSRPGIVVVALD